MSEAYKTLLEALQQQEEDSALLFRHCEQQSRYIEYLRHQAQRWHRAWLWTFGALQAAVAYIIWSHVAEWLMR